MKNYVNYLVCVDTDQEYEFFSPKKGIDFEDVFLIHNKRIPKRIYDEIDLIKKRKIRRMPHPFKDNTQKYS